jgi:DNA-binding FadR family transcriptional regulator
VSEDRSGVVSGKKGRGSGIKSNGTALDNYARRALSAIMANQSTIFTLMRARRRLTGKAARQPCDARQNNQRQGSEALPLSLSEKHRTTFKFEL